MGKIGIIPSRLKNNIPMTYLFPTPNAEHRLCAFIALTGISSGCLKIIFSGGEWPALITTNVPPDWSGFQTFKADVVVDRPCLVGFVAMQGKKKT